jgi:hypothetical protein
MKEVPWAHFWSYRQLCMLFLDVIVGVTIVSKIYIQSLHAKRGAGLKNSHIVLNTEHFKGRSSSS